MAEITVKISDKEAEEYFYNSLCNIGGLISGAGGEIDFEESDYEAAKLSLKGKQKEKIDEKFLSENTICIEDILMEILRMGKKLTWKDIEGDGEYTRSITLKEVHERVGRTPQDHLIDMVEENDDAVTAYVVLQQVFFDAQIFA